MNPHVSIVIPTFHEADNLVELIPRISWALREAAIDKEIIVVDDNSRDGTEEVCQTLAESDDVRLVVRQRERGLATAVLHGLAQAKGKVLLVMDADLSHPPEKLPELVAAIERGADFVIGSRYVEGGTTEEDWGLFRWLNSRIATLLARPLTSAKDPMAGFFALPREIYQRASDLDPIGYKIGLELIIKCGCRRIREVPIRFADRARGESKLCLREQWNYLKHLKRLYDFKFGASRLLQFLAVGATGLVVDIAAFAGMAALLPLGVARALAIWIAMTWNWLLNRKVTFSRLSVRPLYQEYLMFCGSCGVGAVVNWFVTLVLCNQFSFFAERTVLAAVCGVAVGTMANASLCFKYVFGTSSPKEEPVVNPPLRQPLSTRISRTVLARRLNSGTTRK